MLWLRLAWKEISNNYKFSLFFVLNLSIGLIGFIALDSFKHSIEQHLTNNSKAILTADVQISSRFPLTEVETGFAEGLLDSSFDATDQVSFLSMVAAMNGKHSTASSSASRRARLARSWPTCKRSRTLKTWSASPTSRQTCWWVGLV